MADHPEGPQITTGDRTSAWVAAGLVLLAVTGVATIFSESIAAAWSPPSAADPSTAAPAAPATAPSAPGPQAASGDGGHA